MSSGLACPGLSIARETIRIRAAPIGSLRFQGCGSFTEFVASRRRRDNGYEPKRLATIVEHAMYAASRRDDNITGQDGDGFAVRVYLVFAMSGKDRPGVLSMWMNMGSNPLPRIDVPRHDNRIRGFHDDSANRIARVRLEVVRTFELAFRVHRFL